MFLCSLGGFDHHDRLMVAHPGLLRQLSQALGAFQAALDELGLANQVTTFTGSDFGRALTSNGDGTDHGWGGHQFVMGAAVRGQAFYGTPPAPSVGNTGAPDDQWHVGQGRLLPTMSDRTAPILKIGSPSAGLVSMSTESADQPTTICRDTAASLSSSAVVTSRVSISVGHLAPDRRPMSETGYRRTCKQAP